MIRDITLGQYYPADSRVHHLDPRVKLVVTLFYIAAVLLISSLPAYLLPAVFLFAVVKAAKVPFSFMFKGLKAILFLLLFMSVFHLFLTPGEVLIQVWILKITREGVLQAVMMTLRLSLLIMGSSVMTLTTTPTALTDGLERLLAPLNRLHVPVHEIAMMMSIALRFIPILLEETDKIMKAQTARGADFENGGLIQRARSMIPVLVPLFISAFRRASDLAMAMESRCYHGGEGRTKMKPLKYRASDFLAYGIGLCFLGITIGSRYLL